MFVDDSLFANIRETILHSMAASIEALYIILSYPNTTIRQDALSLDKYFESTCSYQRIQLGININTRKMTLGLTEKKRLSMLDELSHWHKKRRSFTLLEGVVLCGSLEFWANTSSWVRFIYHQLRFSINTCLKNCSHITKNRESIKRMMSDLANTKDLDTHELKERFIQRKIAKETYKCKRKTFIDKTLRKELNIMVDILSHPKKFSLETPIAHVIVRDPDFITYGDACLEAGGGYSNNIFWWHIEWPDEIKALTIKNLTVTRKCTITDKLVGDHQLCSSHSFLQKQFIIMYTSISHVTELDRQHDIQILDQEGSHKNKQRKMSSTYLIQSYD